MRYLVVNGSPHKGNTWKLVDLICNEIKTISPDSEFEEIHLYDLNLPFCIGCSLCFRKGYTFCPHNNIVQNILDQIDHSDGVIFAVTTFNLHLTALFKNLIDHFCFMLHRPRFFQKKAIVVSTTNASGAKKTVNYVSETLKAMGFNRCYTLPVSTYSWNSFSPQKKAVEKCQKLAHLFCQDVESRKLHSPSFSALMSYNIFRGMSLGYVKGTEYPTEDGVYWLEPSRAKASYDLAVPVPIHKKIYGNLIYIIGKLIVKHTTITYKKVPKC